MAIKVLTVRNFKEGTTEEAHSLLQQLRAAGTLRPGFVSGQTLTSLANPGRVLVLSTWTDAKFWDAWRASPKRKDIAAKIAELLEAPEMVEAFRVERKEIDGVDMA
jgi:quinol monooxygenase YgiN